MWHPESDVGGWGQGHANMNSMIIKERQTYKIQSGTFGKDSSQSEGVVCSSMKIFARI